MVNSRVGEEMEIGPERSKPLHNFTLPCSLKWGNQKYLRCMKVDDSSTTSTVDHQNQQRLLHRQRRSPSNKNNNNHNNNSVSIITTRRQVRILRDAQNGVVGGDGMEEEEEGIEAVREKIMKDLKTAADKMKDAILREGEQVSQEKEEGSAADEVEEEEEEEEEVRPWNLRTRRSACKAPIGAQQGGEGPSYSYHNNHNNKGYKIDHEMKFTTTTNTTGNSTPVKDKKTKFAVALTKKEIEEDFRKMVGQRPHRRPKKRPRAVQKQLDTLFPGLWLSEVTPDSYRVEVPETGMR
ncbi:DUF1639 domain-containing protein [Cephalotus follicularis]|uniref:DUF1639 domain-containing protein n=1 Tax=Cephalotus follicularis TaxID=3775 RepID=A0A1Q3C214_CEPFO|nr:DUF1639 domain-containing protein [Cephalotus follicularis]